MAARKEILDFIQMMRNHQTRPSLESVSDQTLKIVEIYNERKGDHFTLKNDMWELVTSAISNERRGIERTSFDFVSAITILLQTAADWGLYLPETEIQRYEGVKIGLYDNLAKEIRQIYSHPHRQPDVTKRDTPPEPQRLENLLQDGLETDEAVNVFNKAIKADLMEVCGNGLKWKGTKQLLAYFAEIISRKFELSKKLDKDGNLTTNWKIFENLFDVKDLKDAKQNWMRLNTKFEPTGFEKVDALF